MAQKKRHPSLIGLDSIGQPPDTPRNQNLNAAFAPAWMAPPQQQTVVPGTSGDTQFDPFQGTQWGRWLDSIGAHDPGGAHLGGVKGLPERDMFGASPIDGLQAAHPPVSMPQVQMPKVTQPSVQMGSPDKEMELRVRRARMLNQANPAANFTPHVGGFNPFPSS